MPSLQFPPADDKHQGWFYNLLLIKDKVVVRENPLSRGCWWWGELRKDGTRKNTRKRSYYQINILTHVLSIKNNSHTQSSKCRNFPVLHTSQSSSPTRYYSSTHPCTRWNIHEFISMCSPRKCVLSTFSLVFCFIGFSVVSELCLHKCVCGEVEDVHC